MRNTKFTIITILLMFVFSILFAQSVQIGTVEEPPGNFTDDKGNIAGLSVDFIKEIQKRVGDKSRIMMYPGARLISLSLNEKNFIIFSLSRTESRENKYHWISLVMQKPLVLFALKGSNIRVRNLKDAKKVSSIGVLRSSVQHEYLEANGFKNIDPGDSHETNLRKLINGRLDLMYHTPQGAAKLCKDLNIDYNQLVPVLNVQVSLSSIAMSKGSDMSLVKKWQKAAEDIKKDGTFNRLAQKWLKYTQDIIGIKSHVKDGALNFWPK